MFNFQNDALELNALETLKSYDFEKYAHAKNSDRPDIQDNVNDIGVEVVTAEFHENIIFGNLIGKPFLNFLKMTQCTSYPAGHNKKHLNRQNKTQINFIFDDLLEDNPYVNSNNKAIPLTSIEQLCNFKDKELIYLTAYSHYQYKLDSKGIVQWVIPPAQWTGNIPNMMLEMYEEKAKKIYYVQTIQRNEFIHLFIYG
ncbi:hypothetical protein [Alkalicoccus daliensis]|uniref:Uncharacterized protein n=1 Tax=Alkalicoccus daliensis TaxID=745820 RepID=A0A1H0D3K2_9BACI|nr:hypothetical protein [Alkalicoccus daliensis]SDN64669.1 hypothetical protein SAMN04488053_102330 [Alkalicoccus daliensis]